MGQRGGGSGRDRREEGLRSGKRRGEGEYEVDLCEEVLYRV